VTCPTPWCVSTVSTGSTRLSYDFLQSSEYRQLVSLGKEIANLIEVV
jgi:hypothetical protein